MKQDTLNYYADSYILGNGEFKVFLKKCSKMDLLNIIEILQSRGEQRHAVINKCRLLLEVKQ